MKWRIEVLEAVSKGARRYSKIKEKIWKLFRESIADSSLYNALEDLKNVGFITEIGEIYTVTEVGLEALKLGKKAEREGNLMPGSHTLIGKMFQAGILKKEKKELWEIVANPKKTPQMNVGIVISLPCGHTVPCDSPWPKEMTCLECERCFVISWTPFKCGVCREPRDVSDLVDGDQFFCERCGTFWKIDGVNIKAIRAPPVVLPGVVARLEKVFPIISSHPVRSLISSFWGTNRRRR